MNKEQVEEIRKIAENPFEFLKHVKIQEPGELALEYVLWPHLVHFFRALEINKLIDLLKSKQIGISWALAVHALRRIYTREGSNVLEISKGQVEARSLLEKSRIVYNNLPEWMKIYTLYPNHMDAFGFKELHSKITAYPSTQDAGIGETSDLVIHDEGDFHEFFELNLSHTSATVGDSPNRQLINVSTANEANPDSYWKEHFRAAMRGRNGFRALFYPFDSRPNRDGIWYREKEEENASTPWVVKRNYPRTIEEALSPQSAVSCFNKEVMDILWANVIDDPETRQDCIYILHPPRVGYSYCAGIDVGEGVGLDYSCLVIVGKYGMQSEVAAVIYTNTVGTDSFAFDCSNLCEEYHNPVLVVDNIGIGRAVIDKLVELGYPRLYMMNDKKYGWALTKPNKRDLAVKLIERVNNNGLITRFKPMVKELMEYQWVKGYAEPTGKTHGDLVIALMLACSQIEKIGAAQEASMYIGGKRVW